MLRARDIPLRFRLPLIHGVLARLGGWRGARWPKAGDPQNPRSGDFIVSAFLNESLGIGRAGRLSADAFSAAGYAITPHDLRSCFKNILNTKAVLPGSGGVWFIHANAAEALVALLAHPAESWAGRYRIACWAWETPKAPADWVFVADYLHEIWLPSAFVREAVARTFMAAGRSDLIARLRVMPHPVPMPEPLGRAEAEQRRRRFDLKPEVCEVLAMFDTHSSATRKNPWGAIEAWTRAFPLPSETGRLTLKVSNLARDKAGVRLEATLRERPDIRLMADRLGDTEMDAFIAAFDGLLSLHRSEGFGLPLAEAMAAGVPVIATGWSGNLDFMTPDNARLIPARLIRIHDPDGPYMGLERDPEQVWADPDLDAAAQALRELVGTPSTRHALAEAARAAIPPLSAPWRKVALKALPFNKWL